MLRLTTLMRYVRLLATIAALVAVASCDPGWRYRVRHPSGEPLTSGPEHFATTSLAGGRVEYAIHAVAGLR